LAQCLVQANADSTTTPAARGTIFVYGVDGVCHQLANQVLYSTQAGGAQLTVRLARGYMASTFIYGTYGLQHAAWAAKVAACSGAHLTPPPPVSGVATMVAGSGGPGGPDEFEKQASQVLGANNPKLLDLLRLRSDVHQFAAQSWPGTGQPNADALNARNQHMLDEAAKLLGPTDFKAIFGMDPGETVDLVDPGINRSAGQIPRPKSP
jgi:hypothetical protein